MGSSLARLESLKEMDRLYYDSFIPTVKTKYLGIVGYPLSKSLSPKLHNACFRKLGLDYLYLPIEVREEGYLEGIVKGMSYFNFVGFNVTIPWKEKVIDFLNELDESASLCKSVNTIALKDGKLIGYNTDGMGFMISFIEAFGEGPKGKRVLILGAGGSARSISFEMLKSGVEALVIVNRSVERGERLVKDLNKLFPGKSSFIPLSELKIGMAREFDVIINTTSVGMYSSKEESLLCEEDFRANQLVCDIVYDPPKTKMLQCAERVGAKTLSGKGMLIYQAALAFKIWTDSEPDINLMFEVFDAHFDTSFSFHKYDKITRFV
ncbi:MAG: shikimate dehydrogenase [Synergistetes bacterium]|nr:shikimate dehydrogenase [Synergistota bacterium]MCX8127589.1 shikimate dehydrogenase [Synergistota bacterium]MDW8191494.1 shikimate dehydrogenase [Synergistota bacterium]